MDLIITGQQARGMMSKKEVDFLQKQHTRTHTKKKEVERVSCQSRGRRIDEL